MDKELIELALKGKQTTKSNLPTLSQEKWAIEIRNRYGDKFKIVSLFSADKQHLCESNLDAVYFGAAPPLSRFSLTYGSDVAEAWLMAQIQSIFVYEKVNYEDAATIYQIEMIAKEILANFYYLNLTEIMLFCSRFKAGRYDEQYGNLNGRKICHAISKFIVERNREMDRIERQRKK